MMSIIRGSFVLSVCTADWCHVPLSKKKGYSYVLEYVTVLLWAKWVTSGAIWRLFRLSLCLLLTTIKKRIFI